MRCFSKRKSHQQHHRNPGVLELGSLARELKPSRDRMISDLLQRIGVSEFPDNEHNKWTLLETLHVGRRRYARAEAEPNDVGYDSFVFGFRFADGDQAFVTQAICSEEGGKYHLLATTEHCGEPFPRIVAW